MLRENGDVHRLHREKVSRHNDGCSLKWAKNLPNFLKGVENVFGMMAVPEITKVNIK